MTVTARGAGAPAVGYLEHTREPLLRHLVGGILRRTRREQRRTLHDVAVVARVSTAYLSEVERGRKEASSEVLAAVCEALGMRLVDLVERAWAELALANDARVVDLTRVDRSRVDLSRVDLSRSGQAGFRPAREGAPGPASDVGRRGEAVLLAA